MPRDRNIEDRCLNLLQRLERLVRDLEARVDRRVRDAVFGTSPSQFFAPASSPAAMVRSGPLTLKDISMFASSTLTRTAYPLEQDLQEIVQDLQAAYPDLDADQLLSKVKEWFRKQREYMTHRISTAIRKQLKNRALDAKDFYQGAMTNNDFLDKAFEQSRIQIKDHANRREFIRSKIKSYYERQ